MKREIKFRGKSKDTQLWEYGNLLHKRRTNSKATEIYESYYVQRINFHLELEVIPESIGQFTGFYDKNGKELYEGDVVKDKYGRIMKVDYFRSFLCFIAISKTNFHHANIIEWATNENFTSVEVIGNVHENPELLEKTI